MGSLPDVGVHIAHQADKIYGNVSYTANGFRALTGLQAFRSYDWMTDTRTFNSANNFRGMVISARWGTVYEVISPAADIVGTVATVASIASNAVDMAPQFEAVYRSQDDPRIKALKYTSLTGIVAQKTLAGIITGGVHLIYLPLILGCDEVAKVSGGGRISSAAGVCSQVVKNADALVKNSANYVTDPSNQQKWLQSVVSIFIN